MKRGILFLLVCMLLQGMPIVLCQERNLVTASSLRVSHDILTPGFCDLHECNEDDMQDLTWFEWLQKMFESFMLYTQITICKIRLYVFAQTAEKDISLLQEKLAENLAELGNIKKALYYSQESLHSSVRYLSDFENQICMMQKSEKCTSESLEKLRDQIIQYTQHVQSHIITMTDFASDEKSSDSWQVYEKMLMRYFEKMQQVMQNVDECDELLCKHDPQYCRSASQQAALLRCTENCMDCDFDPEVYD